MAAIQGTGCHVNPHTDDVIDAIDEQGERYDRPQYPATVA